MIVEVNYSMTEYEGLLSYLNRANTRPFVKVKSDFLMDTKTGEERIIDATLFYNNAIKIRIEKDYLPFYQVTVIVPKQGIAITHTFGNKDNTRPIIDQIINKILEHINKYADAFYTDIATVLKSAFSDL